MFLNHTTSIVAKLRGCGTHFQYLQKKPKLFYASRRIIFHEFRSIRRMAIARSPTNVLGVELSGSRRMRARKSAVQKGP